MREMQTGDEIESPTIARATPPPRQMGDIVLSRAPGGAPTPANVLRWVAEAGGAPWFPANHAAAAGLDRDSLDEPLNVLRLAGLVSVGAWVRGTGQGYVLTPEGRDAVETGAGIPGPGVGQTELAAAAISATDLPAVAGIEPATSARLGLDHRPPLVIPFLLIVNVLCFFVGLAGAIRGGYPLGEYLVRGHSYILHRLGAVSGEDLLAGEWWRLFTSCFVHVGALHLMINLLTLAVMGLLAELLWGRWRLAVIYVISGLAGSCAAMASQPNVTLAGASGAIWGLLASQVAWLLLFRRKLPPDVSRDWVRKLGLLLVLNAGVSTLPGVSWEAHLGGGVAGFLSALLLNAVRSGPRWRRAAAVALLAALPLAYLGGLAAAVKWSGPWKALRTAYSARLAREARLARQAQSDAAIREFVRGPGAGLEKLRPDLVTPVEEHARHEERDRSQFWRETEKGKAEFAKVVAQLKEFKSAADSLAAAAAGPASEFEEFNHYRGRVRTFALARAKSFELLLEILAADGKPDPKKWAEWTTARASANVRTRPR